MKIIKQFLLNTFNQMCEVLGEKLGLFKKKAVPNINWVGFFNYLSKCVFSVILF